MVYLLIWTNSIKRGYETMKKIEVKAINVKRIIVPAVASVMLFAAFTPFSKAFA